ncbi:glycoside hydrolase [Methyloprofundus sedimenti]|uniref:Glycoside hydrolase n=1 Tax=Methyloprofundus sedimenti TaxID=1420851 RepID=A0A1V8M5Y3_9GAMM|nr:1,4-alpha-glucan branching protein domain-containing protein [Methyloprofundus sedimenti]OQK16906.1 glycoside hydrolase [Methyloprofundus sedimenti]
MKKGFLSIILHAHLPFVRHPEYDSFFEEIWLFEAITECYVPLIRSLERLHQDRVNYRLTLSLSPPLILMLSDQLLQSRYINYINNRLELAEKEIIRTRSTPEYQKLARLYRRLYLDTLDIFANQYDCNLLTAFKKFNTAGNLELITCAATHGFLPLLNRSEAAVRNQINTGVETFITHIGFPPSGFWLPECGYYPGLEKHLKNAGINYFFVDSHGIENASESPRNGVYAPLNCGNNVMAFARDPESSRQVWSSHEGYPGDYDYREYYRDIGFDLDMDYIAPYILDGHIRINTGIKYHRVTGADLPKEVYQPRQASYKARLHAQDFINKRQQQINRLSTDMDRPAVIVSPYDAELFGHWWFEGPQWLEWVLRFADKNTNGVKTISCSDYLKQVSDHQVATPSASTWGDQGYSNFWINETNDWIYPLLHKAGADMEKLAITFQGVKASPLQERALNQAARSLLLAQASDWPFIMQTGTTVEYATKRITDHLARFNYLRDSIRNNAINERELSALEILDDVFPNTDFRNFNVPKQNLE